jgi:hypothetical protein
MLFSFPLMAAIQEISGRIGRTTGRGIAGNIRRHYPGWLLNVIVGLLFIANTINIGADLGAIGDALVRLSCSARGRFMRGAPGVCSVQALCKWLTLSLFAYFGTVLVANARGGNDTRALLTRAFGNYGILDLRCRHPWDHDQPISVLLAGLPGSRGHCSHAGSRTAKTRYAAGRECARAHPARYLCRHGIFQSRCDRDHGDGRGHFACRGHYKHSNV